MAGLLAAPQALAVNGTALPISRTEGGGPVVAFGTMGNVSCALNGNGSLTCWGNNAQGQITGTPSSDSPAQTHVGPYLSVSPNMHHVCAIKANGDMDCWGNNGSPQVTDRTGPFLSVATGRYHTCALKVGGDVQCWGSNYEGAVGGTEGSNGLHPGPYLAVAGGRTHTCALRATGEVDCWGNNITGEVTGTPTSDGWGETWQLPSIRSHTHAGPYTALSAGTNYSTTSHTCAVKADGDVDCWGYNLRGMAADKSGSFVSVSAGAYHTCALDADGSVTCWGPNSGGRFGYPESDYAVTIRHPGPYLSVASGFSSTCALKVDGGVQCWGSVPSSQPNPLPALSAPGSLGFGQIAAGNAHTCQVKADGSVACWGKNDEDQIAAPSGAFTQVVTGDSHSCAIAGNGTVKCWGRNAADNAEVLNSQTQYLGGFLQLAPGSDGAICGLSTMGVACARRSPGATYGNNFRTITSDIDSLSLASVCGVLIEAPQVGKGNCYTGFDVSHKTWFAGPWQRLESGLNHQCGLKANGRIECWGTALVDGQLNNAPAASETFRSLSVGWNHACAIRGNGTLKCWGSNVNGQATPPAGSDTYVQVAAGNTFTCAIRSDGVRRCWGDDSHGQAPQLQVSPASMAVGYVGVAYPGSFSLVDAGQDADGDYVPPTPAFALVSGALPSGMSLNANGTLSGAPTASGTFNFTVEGEDGNGFVARRAYALTINADSTPPVISYTLNPATPDGTNDWYKQDVTLVWTVVDLESPITKTGCVDATLNSNTPPTGASFSCAASSAGGTATPVNVTLKRDATAPTATLSASVPANALGWHKADVMVVASCGDATPGSAVASCPSVPDVTTEGSGVVVQAVQVTDNAGNTGSSNALTLNIDKTAPTISAATTTSANGSGWYRDNVTVAFACDDTLSGVAACAADQVLSAEGAAVASTAQTSTDNAGNLSAPSNVVTVKIDKTVPTISAAATTLANGSGWYRGNVTVAFACDDTLSGVAACAADQVLSTEGTAVSSTAQTSTDNAGNLSAPSNVVTVKLDKTAPTISAMATSAPDGNNGWYRGNVTVAFACDDALSGVAACAANQVLSTDGASVSSSVQTATDHAGNVSTGSNVITVKIDKTAPTLAPSVPSPILRGGNYSASANASDATSGIASQSCGALDTSTLGGKSTNCAAIDNAGNSATATLAYTVTTTCVNDGYSGTQLTWCRNICEMGYTGATLNNWIHRWTGKYRNLPYCELEPVQQ